jgi:cytochrome c-type biogenesis protein CcmH/NrfG
MTLTLLVVGVLTAVPGAQSTSSTTPDETIASLEQAVAAKPADVERRRRLAEAYAVAGRRLDAVATLRKVTELAPNLPGAWYALGQGYNAIKQDALR